MSEPQIAHRCPACGASIRVRALFCPHCGETLPESQKKSAQDSSTQSPAGKKRKTKVIAGRSNAASNREARVGNVSSEPVAALAPNTRPGPRETLNRARVAAREEIEEDRFQRVERLRHISSVVLDEAAYDPSLRFLLVAAVLFVVFVVMLVVSEVIS